MKLYALKSQLRCLPIVTLYPETCIEQMHPDEQNDLVLIDDAMREKLAQEGKTFKIVERTPIKKTAEPNSFSKRIADRAVAYFGSIFSQLK